MDQESRDANSLLVELDRGLQSQNIGDQSEAVVRFTSLFQRYPLPILINSACLKLAEAFRCGSNFIRVQICEVFERNQSHLNKIYNIDDFYRNIFTVTTSNDPIARSIALLTLGNIAPIVSSYKGIHHCISSSLETTVESELSAAITCAACFVKQSLEFACNIYPKIVSIIDSPKYSTEIKIKALSVLDHGFYNANDAMTVRSFLIDVMEKSQLKKLTCTCLTLSTKIAYNSLSHIQPQINLLLDMFLQDSRTVIKMNVLSNLRFLAEKSPHIWESSHVNPLVSYVEKSLTRTKHDDIDDSCLYAILTIFCKLLTCECNFISQQEKTRIFHQCYIMATDSQSISLCSMAFELLTVMSEEHSYACAKNMLEPKFSELSENTFEAVESFIVNSFPMVRQTKSKSDQAHLQQVRTAQGDSANRAIYRHIVRLCQLNPQYSAKLLKIVFDKMSEKGTSLRELSSYVTELLCAITSLSVESVISADDCANVIEQRIAELSESNLLNLLVLYFQLLRLKTSDKLAEDLIDRVIHDKSLWFGFRVMRQAMRYGHHKIAGLICSQLHEFVTTDTTDFYFKSMGRICSAEATLLQGGDQDANLRLAIPIYEESVSPLRASMVDPRTTNFQLQFLWLRIRTLQAHGTLRQYCKIYGASPITYANLLSAIGASRGGGGDVVLSRLGIIQQMPKIAKDFRYLSECYENLSVISFNCDNCTLDYIQLLKYSCIIMSDVIDAIFQYGRNLPVVSKLPAASNSKTAVEHKNLEETCNNLIERIRLDILKPGIFSGSKTIEPLISLLRSFSEELLKCPFVYPRYFFQPLQVTQVKLAITPQPSQSTQTIALLHNYNLVLKVEGLIQNSCKAKKLIRNVSKVAISVMMTSTKPSESNFNKFVQSAATPHNNYFKIEFLLPQKCIGSFNVDIHVSMIDEQDRTWKTGPTERLNVTVS